MKVLVKINVSPEEKESIEKTIAPEAELIYYHELPDEKKKEALAEAEIIFGGRLKDEELQMAKNLRFHQTFATGVDRHNLKYYLEHKILLANSHVHSETIAEYGFALLLAAAKELVANDKLLRQGIWDYKLYPSVELRGKTILFLGYGKISQAVKKMCEPFKMRFIAIKRTKECKDPDVTIYLPEEKLQAIKEADFIFNALPKTAKTINFLDKEEFNVMKPTAIVVNVGRGATINEEALYYALKEKKIKGAAIDVWYVYPKRRGDKNTQEPLPCYPSKYPFHELDNIIMSAHRAWITDIPWAERLKEITKNINRYIRGEQPENLVNLEEGY